MTKGRKATFDEHGYLISALCKIGNISRAAYYKWLHREIPTYETENKRVLRICRKKGIKSTIKYASNGCTRQAANPQFIAENILNREFSADSPNQKWLTDVTEFKYYVDQEIHKVYLSAILDLHDCRIVSYVLRDYSIQPGCFTPS